MNSRRLTLLDDLIILASDTYGIYTFRAALELLQDIYPGWFDELQRAEPDAVATVLNEDPHTCEGYWCDATRLEQVELSGGYHLHQDLDVWLGTADAIDALSW